MTSAPLGLKILRSRSNVNDRRRSPIQPSPTTRTKYGLATGWSSCLTLARGVRALWSKPSHPNLLPDILCLPSELLLLVFKEVAALDFISDGKPDMHSMMLVCWRWRQVAVDPTLWTSINIEKGRQHVARHLRLSQDCLVHVDRPVSHAIGPHEVGRPMPLSTLLLLSGVLHRIATLVLHSEQDVLSSFLDMLLNVDVTPISSLDLDCTVSRGFYAPEYSPEYNSTVIFQKMPRLRDLRLARVVLVGGLHGSRMLCSLELVETVTSYSELREIGKTCPTLRSLRLNRNTYLGPQGLSHHGSIPLYHLDNIGILEEKESQVADLLTLLETPQRCDYDVFIALRSRTPEFVHEFSQIVLPSSSCRAQMSQADALHLDLQCLSPMAWDVQLGASNSSGPHSCRFSVRLRHRRPQQPDVRPLLSEIGTSFKFDQVTNLVISLGADMSNCKADAEDWRALFDRLPTVAHLEVDLRSWTMFRDPSPLEGLNAKDIGPSDRGVVLPRLRFLNISAYLQPEVPTILKLQQMLDERADKGSAPLTLLKISNRDTFRGRMEDYMRNVRTHLESRVQALALL